MNKNEPQMTPASDPYQFAVRMALSVYVFAFAVVAFYFWNFRKQNLAGDSGSWGQFGDFMGGVINPFVGIVTVFLIVINIRLQRDELRASLAELKKSNENNTIQSFEQSLFSWLSNYHTLLEAISHNTAEGTGRAALSVMYSYEFAGVTAMSRQNSAAQGQWLDESDAELHLTDIRDGVRRSSRDEAEDLIDVLRYALAGYQQNFTLYRSELGPLLRTLFRLIQWIDSSPHPNAVKWHYVALIRAQLSWIELCVLFYSSLTPAGVRFVPLINRYALFDNLDEGADLLMDATADHFSNAPRGSTYLLGDEEREWPFKFSAFSSERARSALGLPHPQG